MRRYVSRGWCRLEAFLGANLPFMEERAELLGGALRGAADEKRRPHVLFGTREMEKGLDPIVLPSLPAETFNKYHPAEGNVTSEGDRNILRDYVTALTTTVNKDLLMVSGRAAATPSSSALERHLGFRVWV